MSDTQDGAWASIRPIEELFPHKALRGNSNEIRPFPWDHLLSIAEAIKEGRQTLIRCVCTDEKAQKLLTATYYHRQPCREKGSQPDCPVAEV